MLPGVRLRKPACRRLRHTCKQRYPCLSFLRRKVAAFSIRLSQFLRVVRCSNNFI